MEEWSYSSTHASTLHHREVSGQLHAPVKSPEYPLNRRLGRLQTQIGNCG